MFWYSLDSLGSWVSEEGGREMYGEVRDQLT